MKSLLLITALFTVGFNSTLDRCSKEVFQLQQLWIETQTIFNTDSESEMAYYDRLWKRYEPVNNKFTQESIAGLRTGNVRAQLKRCQAFRRWMINFLNSIRNSLGQHRG